MRFYEEEEEVWKCKQHPSKRRRCNGVCPLCLTQRLSALCPNCANLRPCSCSSSSFHGGSFARISTLIDNHPPFLRRTRSSAAAPPPEEGQKSSSSIWSVLWWGNSTREKMTRSKSVAVSDGVIPEPAKGKGWYFPSPMKVFRHSKASKVAHERSPLHRG